MTTIPSEPRKEEGIGTARTPGLYWHDSQQFGRRLMRVSYVNWTFPKGHGDRPTDYMPARLRASRPDETMHTDRLTISEWGGAWSPATTKGSTQ